MKKSLITTISALLALTLLVSAIGTTTSTTDAQALRANCDTKAELSERIQCRFAAKASLSARAELNTVEESCRNLDTTKRAACLRLQNAAATCYGLENTRKAACLKTQVGMQRSVIQATTDERRKYAALLFYELQERVEYAHEQQRLTDEEAASLIASIVTIKEKLLQGTELVEIREDIAEFKTEWRAAMQ